MLALATLLDGSNALLFHGEQSPRSWEYRARWPLSEAESLRGWQRTHTVAGESATLALADLKVPLEVEWRWEDGGDEQPWQAAVPHEFAQAAARFAVQVMQDRDFAKDPLVRAMAMVRGRPACFDLAMPRRKVAAGTVLAVPGEAVAPGPGGVLREAGEFACSGPVFKISNTGPSQGALRPAAGPALPGVIPYRGSFFVRAGRLEPGEIELLLESCPKS